MPLSELQIKYSDYLFKEKSKSKISIGENYQYECNGKNINLNQLELMLFRQTPEKKKFPKGYPIETLVGTIGVAIIAGLGILYKFPGETIGIGAGLTAGAMGASQLAAKFVMTPQPEENTYITLALLGGVAGGISGHAIANRHEEPQKQKQEMVYLLDQSPLDVYKLAGGEAVTRKSTEFAYPGIAKPYRPAPGF